MNGLPVPYLNNFYLVIILIWLLLFFGAMILPILTGIMLDSVDLNLKTRANSIANLVYNLFGYFPAPILYGYVRDATGGKESRGGMKMLMFMTLASVTLILILMVFRKIPKEKENIGREKEKGSSIKY